VTIPDFDLGTEAHSDGDVLYHSVTDAILGALTLPDIGQFFPDTDPRWKGCNSEVFLDEAWRQMDQRGYKLRFRHTKHTHTHTCDCDLPTFSFRFCFRNFDMVPSQYSNNTLALYLPFIDTHTHTHTQQSGCDSDLAEAASLAYQTQNEGKPCSCP
jgi:hypothetical protein